MSSLLSRGVFAARAASSRARNRQIDRQIEFLLEHRLGRRADRQMHVVAGREQHFQQPHGIDRAAGAGDRQDHVLVVFISRLRTAWPRRASAACRRIVAQARPARIRAARASPQGNSPTLAGR